MRNRFLEKKFLNGCGIETADFRVARNHRELVVAHQAVGFPGILKLQFRDEEGGPWIVRDFPDVPRALQETKGRPVVWEQLIAVDRAFTVDATRAADGTLETGPAPEAARAIVATVGERLGLAGPYAVRFFEAGERLLVDALEVPGG